MAVETNQNLLRCSRLEISGTTITEREGDRIVISIPREQIRQIKLCYDTDARNPFCQYFLGFTLLSLGLIGLIAAFFAGTGAPSPSGEETGTFLIPLVPVALWIMVGTGFWFLAGIFRARYHLYIDTGNEARKIFFDKTVDAEEIRQFARMARLNFGYEIDLSILEIMSGRSRNQR